MSSSAFPTLRRIGLHRLLSRESGLVCAILVFFFVSGACGLLYQVVWTRKLVLLFGTTSYAVSTVLSIFFLGLGIGSFWGGRIADRLRRPLLAYGLMEILVGLWAVAFILLIDRSESLVVSLLRGSAHARALGVGTRAMLATVFLIVPVTLMGATLPMLARFVTMQGPVRGFRVGALYTLNTFGAVAGCAAAGFVLIEQLGYTQTTYVGAFMNIGVGLLAIALSGWTREGVELVQTRVETGTGGRELSRVATAAIVVAFAVSGFASLGLEVIWTRLLVLVFYGTTFAFTTMLTSVLCGIAVGSAVASAFIDRVRDRVALFGLVQIATAIACLLSLGVFPVLPERLRDALFESGHQWQAGENAKFFLSFSVLFWPTFLFGMSFPVAFRALADSRERLGSDLGRLYGANTFGGVIGSLAGGFVLLPMLGAHRSIVLLSLLVAATGFGLLAAGGTRAWVRRAAFGVAGAAALGWLLTTLPDDVSRAVSLWPIPGDHDVIHFDEGVEGTVLVSSPKEETHGTDRVLWINSIQATTSIEKGVKMNRFQGALPLLFDREMRTALFMCFGSGVTAGTLSLGPFERIDAVEISEGVLEAAPLFEADNFSIADNPRGNVNFIVDDGRNFLLTTRNLYDLITFEPMPLALAGVSTFYTREYYELCGARLTDGGLVSQWVPFHGLRPDVVESLVRTFVEVFPDSTGWFINADLFLIGSNRPLALDVAKARERIMGNEAMRAALEPVYLGDLHELYADFVMGKEALRAFAGDAPVMTDDRPWAEFVVPRIVYQNHVQAGLIAMQPYVESPIPWLAQEGNPEWSDWIAALDRRVAARKTDLEGLMQYYAPIRSVTMEDYFRQSLATDPGDLNARFYLGEILAARGRAAINFEAFDEAAVHLEEAIGYNPNRRDLYLALGAAYRGLGDSEKVQSAFGRYLELGGTNSQVQALMTASP